MECTPTTFKEKVTINNILIYELWNCPRNIKQYMIQFE